MKKLRKKTTTAANDSDNNNNNIKPRPPKLIKFSLVVNEDVSSNFH